MRMLGFRRGVIAALVLAGAFDVALAGDVYVSHAGGDAPVYATQPLDSSFTLLLRDEAATARAYKPLLSSEAKDMRQRRESLEPLIREAAARHGLEPALVRAIAHVESRFNVNAVSPAGAVGVMQLMPGTAKRYGATSRTDPAQNLDAGARYFKDLLGQYSGNIALALAAYNSGERNVERHAKRVPPFRETMLYVPEVLTRYEHYRQAELAGQAPR